MTNTVIFKYLCPECGKRYNLYMPEELAKKTVCEEEIMNNWKFDMKSAAVGGISTLVFQTALFLIAIAVIGDMGESN